MSVPITCVISLAVCAGALGQILPAHVPGGVSLGPWVNPLEYVTVEDLIAHLPPATQEWSTDPVSGYWKEDPYAAEFQRRLNAGQLTQDQIGAALKACAMLRGTPYAFKGEEYPIRLRVPHWLEYTDVTAQARLEHAKMASAWWGGSIEIDGTFLSSQEDMESFQKIGVIPPDATQIVFDVAVTQRPGTKVMWRGEMTLPIQVVERASPRPADSPELRQEITNLQRLSLGFVGSPDSPFGLMSGLVERPVRSPLDDCYASRAMDLLKDGKVVQTFILRDPSEILRNNVGWHHDEYLDEKSVGDLAGRKNLERYAVRVRGVPPMGLPRWPRTQYWNGEITMPITELLGPAAPARE